MYKTDLSVHKPNNDYIDQTGARTSFASIQKASPRKATEEDTISEILQAQSNAANRMKTPELQKKAFERLTNS